MTAVTVGPLTELIALRSAEPLQRALDGPLADSARAILEGLHAPVRLAVAGRVKAGKSTLVNALLRQKVAPTAIGECTRYVTWYRHGVPERVTVVHHDGQRTDRALDPDGSLPEHLDVPADRIAHLEVSLSIEALRSLWVVDTPGLASATPGRSDATRELLALDADSRHAIAGADGLLLVMAVEPRADDVAAVDGFHRNFAGLRRSSVTTVAVLNKVDQLAGGQDALRGVGRELADRCAEQLPTSTLTVLPLVALVAETVDTGALTEADADALREIAGLDAEVRDLLLMSPQRFIAHPIGVAAAARRRLLDLLDMGGVREALLGIDDGDLGAAAIARRLREASGISALQQVLTEQLRDHADAMKATWAIAALERLAYAPEIDAAVQGELRQLLEDVELDPAFRDLNLLRALQRRGSGDVDLPAALDRDLRRLAAGGDVAERLGIHDTEVARDREDVLAETVARWRGHVNGPRAGSEVRQVGDAVLRTLDAFAGEPTDEPAADPMDEPTLEVLP